MLLRNIRSLVLRAAGAVLLLAAGLPWPIAGAILLPSVAHAQAPAGLVAFPHSSLAIQTGEGKRHSFKVEVASSAEERAQGLMFRRSLAPDAGMLFDFGRTEPVAMWMKNTLIPLDMLFIAGDGAVVNIAQRTVPGSLTPIPSAKPVRFVLELAGGTAARLAIKPGDKVIHPLFGNAGD